MADEPRVIIAGPAQRDPTPRASFVLSFGPRSALSDEQLKTIAWFRHLGASPRMKKNNVQLVLGRVSQEKYERIIALLEKERISFSEEQTR